MAFQGSYLSTPSLGITAPFYPQPTCYKCFQLPLSGSRRTEDVRGRPRGGRSFNSLSRDHLNLLKIQHGKNDRRLSTPSLGITMSSTLTRTFIMPVGTFNSLSRDHRLIPPAAKERRIYCFQLPLSGSLGKGPNGNTVGISYFQLPLSGSRAQ